MGGIPRSIQSIEVRHSDTVPSTSIIITYGTDNISYVRCTFDISGYVTPTTRKQKLRFITRACPEEQSGHCFSYVVTRCCCAISRRQTSEVLCRFSCGEAGVLTRATGFSRSQYLWFLRLHRYMMLSQSAALRGCCRKHSVRPNPGG